MSLNQGGFTHIAPTFITVGGVQSVPLSSFVGNFEEFDSIQFIDPLAGTASECFWLVEGSAAPAGSGWHLDDFSTEVGVTPVNAGSSFFYSSVGSTELTLSGEVGASGVSVTTGAGFTAIGNPFPVDTTLENVSFTGISEFSSVQIIGADASTANEYFWLEEGSAAPSVTGWYVDDFSTYAGTLPLAAAQGFLLNTDAEGVVVSVASPL